MRAPGSKWQSDFAPAVVPVGDSRWDMLGVWPHVAVVWLQGQAPTVLGALGH